MLKKLNEIELKDEKTRTYVKKRVLPKPTKRKTPAEKEAKKLKEKDSKKVAKKKDTTEKIKKIKGKKSKDTKTKAKTVTKGKKVVKRVAPKKVKKTDKKPSRDSSRASDRSSESVEKPKQAPKITKVIKKREPPVMEHLNVPKFHRKPPRHHANFDNPPVPVKKAVKEVSKQVKDKEDDLMMEMLEEKPAAPAPAKPAIKEPKNVAKKSLAGSNANKSGTQEKVVSHATIPSIFSSGFMMEEDSPKEPVVDETKRAPAEVKEPTPTKPSVPQQEKTEEKISVTTESNIKTDVIQHSETKKTAVITEEEIASAILAPVQTPSKTNNQTGQKSHNKESVKDGSAVKSIVSEKKHQSKQTSNVKAAEPAGLSNLMGCGYSSDEEKAPEQTAVVPEVKVTPSEPAKEPTPVKESPKKNPSPSPKKIQEEPITNLTPQKSAEKSIHEASPQKNQEEPIKESTSQVMEEETAPVQDTSSEAKGFESAPANPVDSAKEPSPAKEEPVQPESNSEAPAAAPTMNEEKPQEEPKQDGFASAEANHLLAPSQNEPLIANTNSPSHAEAASEKKSEPEKETPAPVSESISNHITQQNEVPVEVPVPQSSEQKNASLPGGLVLESLDKNPTPILEVRHREEMPFDDNERRSPTETPTKAFADPSLDPNKPTLNSNSKPTESGDFSFY